MSSTTFSGPVTSTNGFVGSTSGVVSASAGSTLGSAKFTGMLTTAATVTNGAGAGTITLPTGCVVTNISFETAVAIPGTPTNTNMRLGSSANGQQYVADVDVKAQGWIDATVVYAGRNPATTVHWTVASSGGTAADQDGVVLIHIRYAAA